MEYSSKFPFSPCFEPVVCRAATGGKARLGPCLDFDKYKMVAAAAARW